MSAQYPLWLQNFINTYQQLGVSDFYALERIYHRDVTFIDPMHHIDGLPELISYFERLYTHVDRCQFLIDEVFYQHEQAAIYWRMQFSHQKLNRGQTIEVTGHSQLKARDNLVIWHRDYFDVGQMLYQHIPLLGRVIKAINARAAQ